MKIIHIIVQNNTYAGKRPIGRPRRRCEDNIKIYRIIILPVVLCGSKMWYLCIKGETQLRIFENRILSPIFEPKIDKNEKRIRHHNDMYYFAL